MLIDSPMLLLLPVTTATRLKPGNAAGSSELAWAGAHTRSSATSAARQKGRDMGCSRLKLAG